MEKLTEVNAQNPCIHCGKPDWCYILPNKASVCNRGNIAPGYVDSGKKDKQGAAILYPAEWGGKAPEPKVIKRREWVYVSRLEPHPDLVKVVRQDLDNGKKRIFQLFWNGQIWEKKRPKSLEREEIPVYRYLAIQKAISDGLPIFIVEGEKCADLLWKIGLPATCNIKGANSFCLSDAADVVGAKQIILCPDRDRPGVELMEKWANALGGKVKWLYAYPDKDWGRIPISDGLDIYDWIIEKELSSSAVVAEIGKIPPGLGTPAPTVETTEPLKPPRRETKRIYGGTKPLNAGELIDFVESEIAHRLEFDDLRSEILLDGVKQPLGQDCKVWFYRTFGEVAAKDDVYGAIVSFAKDRAFNPVGRYLDACLKKPARVSIDDIATRYFGRSEPIYNLMVRYWLISAVARALDKGTDDKPGVQVDHTLVLQSSQGRYKSTFFAVLGGAWFSASVKDIESKDSLLVVHSNWILELAELDRVTSKKEAGAIKHWLTQTCDSYRKPYARELEPNLPRPCVFCATVNPSRFLVDEENRRFWIVPVADNLAQIDIPLLQEERDGIWASALLEYRYGGLFPLLRLLFKVSGKLHRLDAASKQIHLEDKPLPRNFGALWSLLVLMPPGARWWPTQEEAAAITLLNLEFKEFDTWQDPIESWIEHREWVSNWEILTELFKIEPGQIKRGEDMRVNKILSNLGWTKETRREIPDENGVMKFRRVRLNPKILKSSGKVGKVGKSPSGSGFQTYQPPEITGKGLVSDNLPTLPDENYHLPTPQTLTESGVYQPTGKNHNFSGGVSDGEWKSPNGNLKTGVWIVTRNRVRAWVSCPSPLGGAWLCLSENGEDLQVSEGEILWVWEES